MSNEKSSNPHAFPVAGKVEFPDKVISIVQEGMTLRDWFAGQFMAAILSSPSNMGTSGTSEMAKWAYTHADAMLKAREET